MANRCSSTDQPVRTRWPARLVEERDVGWFERFPDAWFSRGRVPERGARYLAVILPVPVFRDRYVTAEGAVGGWFFQWVKRESAPNGTWWVRTLRPWRVRALGQ